MRKLYANNTTTNKHSIKLMLFVVLLLTSIYGSYGQVRVPFTPRAADATPSKTNYNIKGDFTMVGNTNLTLVSYSDDGGNEQDMEYVDADDSIFPGNTFNTFNSSSATVTFSTENGAIPDCSNIIYAGLYWTGRADFGADDNADNDNDPNTFEVTKNGVTKQFDKRQVRIKGPGASGYTTVTAGASSIISDPINIAYPTNGDQRNMYAGYADVTSYVKDVSTGGIGDYFVGDIALKEGTVDGTGYYGGWGMVIVYENSKMNWRDITVFDGHAYVTSGNANHTINVAGFNAVQSGAVNVKLGVMAGEGDVDISGDYFEIQRQIDGAYQRLSHAGNSTNNFFNSSITNTNRLPNSLNNTGLDIAMFDIDNTNNDVITNNQTSTVLRYGSTQDTYIIFNVTFAVDAYVPEPEGVLNITSVNGNLPNPPDILQPGQNSEYTIEIKNTGTEATDNTVITIPLPDTVNPSGLNIISNLPNPSIFTTPNTPSYQTGPGFGTNGSIVWDLGTLPNPADTTNPFNPETVLATISFRLTVTTDCTMLTDPNFNPDVSLSGTISGTGAISNIPFSFPLIQGYQLDGLCIGEPIPTPVIIGIDYLDYVNEGPTASNPDPINVQCISDVPAFDVNVVTDEADNQGTPTVAFVSDVSDGNTCPETITRTYSVTDDCGNSINVTQTITVNDDTDPTVSGSIADTTLEGCSIADATPENTVAGLEALGLTIADNCTSNTDLVVTNTDTATGTCPTVVNRIYTITDACGNSVTASQTINVNDTTAPTASNPVGITIPGGPAPAPDIEVVTDEADNCTANPTVAFVSDVSDNGTCPEIITRTYSVTDDCENTINVTQIITISDPIVPTASNPDPINVQCTSDVPAPDIEVVTDEADNQGTPTVAFVSDVSDSGSNPEVITRVYSVTDICGNSINVTQTITINDTTNPTITCPSDISVNADAGSCEASSVNLGTPTTDDNCSVDTVENDAPAIYPLGDTIVTWTVTDIAGNSTTCTQTVTVVDDAAPTIACPIDVTVNVDADLCTATNVDLGTPNASDCTAVTFSNDAPTAFPQGDTVVTWTITDDAGNSVTCTQVVTVIDNINPTFVEALPADTTVECSEIPDAEELTATDNCGSAEVTFNEERIDGSCESNFTLVRTWTATDTSGLTTIHTQNITVQDTTRPEFVEDLPGDITVECDAIPNVTTLTATDNCSNATVSVSDVIINGNCANNYIIERTWIATDACGLILSHTQTITVQDTTAPVPATTFDETLDVSCADVPDAPVLEFVDNCSGNAGITVVFEETNTFDENALIDYQIIRTWTVTDECANQETYTQTLNVSLDEIITDIVAPDICFDQGAIDLNTLTPDGLNNNGDWELLEGDSGAVLNNNIFDPTNIEWDANTVLSGLNYKFRYTTTDNGCISINNIVLSVNYCIVLPCGENDIVISKAITPNGDGFNESFDISGIELCGFTANIKIFNRWGALVYESNNYQIGEGVGSWKGNSPKSSIGNNGKLPNGTYYYIINLENSGLKPLTGPIYVGTK